MFNKEERQFYRLDNILSCKANYMLIYGMRANGKSYAVKERAVIRAYEKNEIFTYLRRWGQDIKQKEVDNYFDDIPVNKITNGEYDGITAYQGSFYFFNNLENGRKDRAPKAIGRYCALNEAERYKSQVFNSERIIFEEVFTDKIYLGSKERPEPRLLMQFVSTVARDRNIEVYLIANTVSRVNPYVGEWGLKNVLQQKPGTIDVYHLRGENGVVDIAVENCEVIATKSKMFFGRSSKQITSGEWETDEMPKLLKPYEYYDMLYEVKIIGGEFKYCAQLMYDPDTQGLFVYIYPLTKDRKILRTITNEFYTDPFITKAFRSDIEPEVLMAQCFRRSKVCYSDNLTGTDFRQVLKMYELGVTV